jgi:Uma2 family endonuclease
VPRLLTTRRFNVYEYHRMAAAGILGEDDRVELIEGEIALMAPLRGRHSARVSRLASELFAQVGGRGIVRVQDAVRLSDESEPQPDLALVKPRADFYAAAHPGPEDILLIIEVADATADYDRSVKARLYAEADIPEYWLVDLTRDRVDAHLQPVDGRYKTVRAYRRGERLRLEALPGVDIAIDDILG